MTRRDVDPMAREGWKDVTLPWIKKHAQVSEYRVRWWDGPTGHDGKWQEKHFPASTTLADVKGFAECIARVDTLWEVEITLLGRRHSNRCGWEYASPVWTFGHFKRNDEHARRLRGEA